MQRLKLYLDNLNWSLSDFSLEEVFGGEYLIPSITNPEVFNTEFDPTYWLEDGCFMQITPTAPDLPTLPCVTFGIPAERLRLPTILNGINEVDSLKRLKNILLGMEENTATYPDLYSGVCEVVTDGERFLEHDPVYWKNGAFYSFEKTHKLAQDRPSVTIGVPAEDIGVSADDYVVADYCLRRLKPYLDELNDGLYNRSRPVEENGWYFFCEPEGEVLQRNGAYFAIRRPRDYDYGVGIKIYPYEGVEIEPKLYLCFLIQVQLPIHRLKKTIKMLTIDLPRAIDAFIRDFNPIDLQRVINLSSKQKAIREWLKTSDYCAFIANGSILPRSKGTDLPMENAVPFESPEADEIEICGVKGMGIRRGVTVITGGGYSGKSTLLDAIAKGIYNHCLGDGRELCLTDETAVTICAEDGRSIKHVNISPFIRRLPSDDTTDFSTEHASGSTSQAANIMEAVDAGAKLLLIDEDRSATNFMIRDGVMRKLIEDEPIIPFTERVRELSSMGVSTVLVIGGSGEYLSVADRVYIMKNFEPCDVTEESKELIDKSVGDTVPDADWCQRRKIYSEGFSSYPISSGRERLSVIDLGILMIGSEDIDLRGLHDIATPRQLHAIGFILRDMMVKNVDEVVNINVKLDSIYDKIAAEGLDCVYTNFLTTTQRFFDLPRKQEIFAVINRMRLLRIGSVANNSACKGAGTDVSGYAKP